MNLSNIAQAPKLKVSWMLRRHLPEVLRIEAASFEHPWTEEDFFRTLRNSRAMAAAAELEGRVVGYLVYLSSKTRLELISLAVSPEFRRQGIGRALVGARIRSLERIDSRRLIVAEISERNLEAQLFFRAMGFAAVSVVREPYGNGDDAYRMEYRLPAAEPGAASLPCGPAERRVRVDHPDRDR